eukprot:gi/632967125/ref/XP_007899805.1/ PREDICTED: thyrotropin subunit beta [Callorhinchus milii]
MSSRLLLLILFLCGGRAHPYCSPSPYLQYLEQDQCEFCLVINTTICSGSCLTRDANVKRLLPKSALSQNICTFDELEYRTVRIPGCPTGVSSQHSYPTALSCKCKNCDTDYTDCTVQENLEANVCRKPQSETNSQD